MKRPWIFLALLSASLSVQAQFHTIASHKPLYKVHEITEKPETKDLPEIGEVSNDVSRTRAAGKHKSDAYSRWIDCYMSVSYPLKKIVVTSPYGLRKDPFTGKRTRHNGLDLRARNEDVYAMMPGEVIKVASDRRSDNYVTLRHGDYTVSYCHLSKIWVRHGAKVMPGEVVAVSGNTGRSSGPHLHITARYGRKHIDPSILLCLVRETQEEALSNLLAE